MKLSRKVRAILGMGKIVWAEAVTIAINLALVIARLVSGHIDVTLVYPVAVVAWCSLCAYYHLWTDALRKITGSLGQILVQDILKSIKTTRPEPKKVAKDFVH